MDIKDFSILTNRWTGDEGLQMLSSSNPKREMVLELSAFHSRFDLGQYRQGFTVLRLYK